MALTDENGGMNTTMLVSPTGGNTPYPYPVFSGSQGGGNQNGMDNGWWVILVIILLAAGAWGGQNGGNGGGAFGSTPIVVNDGNGSSVQRGFDQAAVMSGVGAIQNGINNLSTQLCNCCGDMQMSLANGFAGVEQSANARQMADMNQNFALQTAMMQGFNGVGTQFADCCCENRLGIADLKYTIATENCADRQTINEGIRDVITNQTANTQAILDKLCQQELDAERRENQNLRSQLNMATLQASQTAQTAEIQRGQVAEVDALYNRLRDCPVPTQPVYGSQPIFTCPNDNNGCGCGCGNF